MGSVPAVRGYGDLVLIGRGGFASVYRARQLAFDRDVALKVIDQGHADGRDADQFARECRAIGSLSWHPHVVPVYDAGRTEDGAPYMAMELVPGGSLADALAGGPLPAAAAVGHIRDVADALDAAHEVGVLHRDVKPANILLDRRGRARLADFGIARMAGSGPTTTGAVTGTIAYMAPEVLAGERASTASDVYALGVTLATLLHGRNPYIQATDDNPFAVLNRVMADETPALPATVPPAVAAVVAHCMARDPAARPASAAAVQDALTTLDLTPAPPPAAPTAPPPPAGATWTPPAAPADANPATPPPAAAPPPPGATFTPPAAPADANLATPPPPPGATWTPPAQGGDRAVPPPPASALRPRDDVTAGLPPEPPATRVQPAPGPAPDDGRGPGLPLPPPPTGARPRRRGPVVAAVVALVVVGLLAAVAVGAALWLGRDNDTPADTTLTTVAPPGSSTTDTTDTTDSTTSTTEATTTTAPETRWEAPGDPSADQQTLLDNAATMFVAAEVCRPIDDGEPDPLNVYPQGPDVASIECFYGDDATIVFSLFADDAGMEAFFADRLDSRGLARGTGTIGPDQPWQLDYADDPDRGRGSIFGVQRDTAGGNRSEIGFIRSGLRTYAYSFSVGADFPSFYAWWSERFGGPAG
ncbi:MAG TPA: serine/threonine-protein kinase [Iamia sp.]|nr:serine/threonine-protein kinase [Iamia sp.]